MDFNFWKKQTVEPPVENKAVAISLGQQQDKSQDYDIYKAYVPEFLYKPYFGYPRAVNILTLRKLGRNPYVFPVMKTITDEVSNANYDLVEKEDVEVPPEIEEAKGWFLKWLYNPNGNYIGCIYINNLPNGVNIK